MQALQGGQVLKWFDPSLSRIWSMHARPEAACSGFLTGRFESCPDSPCHHLHSIHNILTKNPSSPLASMLHVRT